MKIFYLLLLLMRYITKPVDPFVKVGLGLIALGILPLGSGIAMHVKLSKEKLSQFVPFVDAIELTWSEVNTFALWFGMIISSLGLISCIIALIIYSRSLRKKDVAVFVFLGFDNLNDPDLRKLLSAQDRFKHVNVDIPKINSRNKTEFMSHCEHIKYIINRRVNHKATESGHLFALGSTPSLYAFGSFFRDGHIPLTIYDFKRTDNVFIPLNDYPSGSKLIFKYNDNGIDNLNEATLINDADVALSISFTSEVMIDDLPVVLRNNVVDVSLSDGYKYYSLPEEEEQKNIALQITHIISSLKNRSRKVHLFISAQASMVTRLGTLYQQGMHGEIEIYQWNPVSREYEWSISVNGDVIN